LGYDGKGLIACEIHSTSKGGQYLKKRRISPLIAFILAVYFLFIKDKFPVVDALPTVMEEEFNVMLNEKRKYVYLEKDGEEQSIGIAIDDEKTLYIANPIGTECLLLNVSLFIFVYCLESKYRFFHKKFQFSTKYAIGKW
jgi:hypothetical protein